MKKLSIIIVNYNVRFFLEQCLLSISEAIKNIETEVWVVDNNSSDSSVQMVNQKFPWVNLIENKENVGFSKANNQAIRLSSSEYVLLLNPDTLVQPDTFIKTLHFMDAHLDVGALGVKMIDGKGKYLPESKRGLTTAWVAFYKMFGFSSLFPRSKIFGKYYLSFLDPNSNHYVEVISGAFMLIRRSVLEKVGLLDENFFMYGEDIDLSYRILKVGYKNFYFAETTIVHYKGESTKKSSLNYVKIFYKAMEIFAQKHFSSTTTTLFFLIIRLAIYFRALIDILKRILQAIALPLIDFILIIAGFSVIANYWEQLIVFPRGGSYPELLLRIALVVYSLIWIFSGFFAGVYDKHVNLSKIFKGIGFGTVLILIIYSLLDQSLRFSRALILLGSVWAIIVFIFNRLLYGKMTISFKPNLPKRFLIAGNNNDVLQVHKILEESLPIKPEFVGYISGDINYSTPFLGNIEQIEDIVRIHNIDEIIFSSKSIKISTIIQSMTRLQELDVSIKIAPADAKFILGSNSVNEKGDVYLTEINAIHNPENRRKKRIFDIMITLGFIILYPIIACFVKRPIGFIRNIFLVLLNRKTWVGFIEIDNESSSNLPKGVLTPDQQFTSLSQINSEMKQQINIIYARNYSIRKDVLIIFNAFSELGN